MQTVTEITKQLAGHENASAASEGRGYLLSHLANIDFFKREEKKKPNHIKQRKPEHQDVILNRKIRVKFAFH